MGASNNTEGNVPERKILAPRGLEALAKHFSRDLMRPNLRSRDLLTPKACLPGLPAKKSTPRERADLRGLPPNRLKPTRRLVAVEAELDRLIFCKLKPKALFERMRQVRPSSEQGLGSVKPAAGRVIEYHVVNEYVEVDSRVRGLMLDHSV